MIQLAIKHYIMDVCLSKLFEGLIGEFANNKITLDMYKVGDYMKVNITIGRKHTQLSNCKLVTSIGTVTYIECNDFAQTILIITDGKEILDIKGSYDIISEHFVDTGM